MGVNQGGCVQLGKKLFSIVSGLPVFATLKERTISNRSEIDKTETREYYKSWAEKSFNLVTVVSVLRRGCISNAISSALEPPIKKKSGEGKKINQIQMSPYGTSIFSVTFYELFPELDDAEEEEETPEIPTGANGSFSEEGTKNVCTLCGLNKVTVEYEGEWLCLMNINTNIQKYI